MDDLLVSFLVFAVILGGALVGVVIRPFLSEKHAHPDSRELVKMTTGLVGTLAALVLGLLVASAKSSFDLKTSKVRQVTASIILLDDLLAQYGPAATSARTRLRQTVQPLADRIWHEDESPADDLLRFQATAQSLALESELERLSPTNDAQRSLRTRAIQTFTESSQIRLQLFTESGGAIPTPFLIILVFWLSAIFASFTLFAQANLIVMTALFVSALSFAGAIFLILELEDPFKGLMEVPSATLRGALPPLPASPGGGSSE